MIQYVTTVIQLMILPIIWLNVTLPKCSGNIFSTGGTIILKKENIIFIIEVDRNDLEECIIFGFPLDHNIVQILNLILLHAKAFVYKAKNKDTNPECLKFLQKLRESLNIEKHISNLNKTYLNMVLEWLG